MSSAADNIETDMVDPTFQISQRPDCLSSGETIFGVPSHPSAHTATNNTTHPLPKEVKKVYNRTHREKKHTNALLEQLGETRKKISIYKGDRERGKFINTTQISNIGMVKPYGFKESYLGVLVEDDSFQDPYFVEEARIMRKEAITLGIRGVIAMRLTGPIKFGSGNTKHICCEHFGERVWYQECDVIEQGVYRKRGAPSRDLNDRREVKKFRSELSFMV